jgi:nitrate/nitrite transporter NarK
MSHQEIALLVASVVAIVVALIGAIGTHTAWDHGDVVGNTLSVIVVLLMVGVTFGMVFTMIDLHDPEKAAAFDACKYPKPHMRPANCVK